VLEGFLVDQRPDSQIDGLKSAVMAFEMLAAAALTTATNQQPTHPTLSNPNRMEMVLISNAWDVQHSQLSGVRAPFVA
jgi:hypothetical protein